MHALSIARCQPQYQMYSVSQILQSGSLMGQKTNGTIGSCWESEVSTGIEHLLNPDPRPTGGFSETDVYHDKIWQNSYVWTIFPWNTDENRMNNYEHLWTSMNNHGSLAFFPNFQVPIIQLGTQPLRQITGPQRVGRALLSRGATDHVSSFTAACVGIQREMNHQTYPMRRQFR